MKNLLKLAAVATLCIATPAFAGKGGSATKIRDAISSHSQDAIIAEVERAESLICGDCVTLVTGLTDDSRYEVRAVAAWWIAKRPGLKAQLAVGFKTDLVSGDSHHVRNAADFLGRSSTFDSLPQLRTAIHRTGLDSDAKIAIVRAVEHLANLGGNEVLTTAMTDGDAKVRAAAAATWREIRGQKGATPVVALLADSDAAVRAEAATAMGAMRETSAIATLETMVVRDASALVRKNAAWALGKLGAQSSRAALTTASADQSGLVRMTAKASLASIK
jgi:hypothetical protein